MTAPTTTGGAAIEKLAADSRVLRAHMIATDPSQAACNVIAEELAKAMREKTDPATAIEWGRGLLLAGCIATPIAIALRANGHDVDTVFLNMLGWAGLDLMDGTP